MANIGTFRDFLIENATPDEDVAGLVNDLKESWGYPDGVKIMAMIGDWFAERGQDREESFLKHPDPNQAGVEEPTPFIVRAYKETTYFSDDEPDGDFEYDDLIDINPADWTDAVKAIKEYGGHLDYDRNAINLETEDNQDMHSGEYYRYRTIVTARDKGPLPPFVYNLLLTLAGYRR